MNNLPQKLQGSDFANTCAEHTRRVEILSCKFWNGDLDMWQYRKLLRDLTQQFMNELAALLNRTVG